MYSSSVMVHRMLAGVLQQERAIVAVHARWSSPYKHANINPGITHPQAGRATRLSLSRLKLPGPPTPRDTEASNAYAVIHDALGPVYSCSFIGIHSIV